MRKLPVKLKKIELTGEYEGWELTMRVNPPFFVFDQIQSGEVDQILDALGLITTEWNFVDENGEPMPPPSKESYRLLPYDLVLEIVDKFTSEVTSLLPKSEDKS